MVACTSTTWPDAVALSVCVICLFAYLIAITVERRP
jgi:hypothetical protein